MTSLGTTWLWWGIIFLKPVCMAWGSSAVLLITDPFSFPFKISPNFLIWVWEASCLQLIGQADNWQIWDPAPSVSGTLLICRGSPLYLIVCWVFSAFFPQGIPPIPLNGSKHLQPKNKQSNKRPFGQGKSSPSYALKLTFNFSKSFHTLDPILAFQWPWEIWMAHNGSLGKEDNGNWCPTTGPLSEEPNWELKRDLFSSSSPNFILISYGPWFYLCEMEQCPHLKISQILQQCKTMKNIELLAWAFPHKLLCCLYLYVLRATF